MIVARTFALVVGLLGAFLILAAAFTPARAGDFHSDYFQRLDQRKRARMDENWRTYRRHWRPRKQRRKRRAPAPKPRRPVCLAQLSVAGTKHLTEKGARAMAERQWQTVVGLNHGAIYADPRFASGVSMRCVDYSIRNAFNRLSEKVGINTQFKLCVMTAAPCIAPDIPEGGRQ